MAKLHRRVEDINWVLYIECTECHQMKECSTKEYFKWNCAHWLRSKCKECIKNKYADKALEYRITNRDKINKQKRDAHKRDREKISEKRKEKREGIKARRKKYYEVHKEEELEYTRKKKRETGKGKLWTRTEKLIKKLWLSHDWCSICWTMWQTQAHHPDYNKWNEVIFLCPTCHQRVHAGRIECHNDEIIDSLLIDKFNEMSKDWIGVEIPWRYDGIAYYLNEKTWQRYSKKGFPIGNDEVCRYWEICKVEFYDERGCNYKILSRRPDWDGHKSAEMS